MSLANHQILRHIEQFVRTQLRSGIYPTVNEVIQELTAWIKTQRLGLPSFVFRPVGQAISSGQWNEDQERISQDLTDLYDETKEQLDQAIVGYFFGEAKRKQLLHTLQELQNQIDTLLLANPKLEGYLAAAKDTFENLSRVSPESTIELNATGGFVSPPVMSGDFAIVDLSTAKLSVTYQGDIDHYDMAFANSLLRLIDDKLDTFWQAQVFAATPNPIKAIITIDLPPETVANRLIVASLDTSQALTARVVRSGQFTTLGETKLQKMAVFDLPYTNVEQIVLELLVPQFQERKQENGPLLYEFLPTLSQVQLLRVTFAREGVLVTRPRELVDNTGEPIALRKLSLSVKEDVPTGTAIRYKLKLPGQFGTLAIRPLERSTGQETQVIDLKVRGPESQVVFSTAQLTEDQAVLVGGLNFYEVARVTELADGKAVGGLKLYKGPGQWRHTRYHYEWPTPQSHVPSADDFLHPPVHSQAIKRSYVSDNLPLLTFQASGGGYNHEWRTRVRPRVATKVNWTLVGNSRCFVQVSINGDNVFADALAAGERKPIGFDLDESESEVVFRLYQPPAPAGEVLPALCGFTIDGLSLTQATRGELLADGHDAPLLQVFPYELFYSIPFLHTQAFGFEAETGGFWINEATMKEECDFLLVYSALTQEVTGQIQLIAEFSAKEGVQVSPKLYEYTLLALP